VFEDEGVAGSGGWKEGGGYNYSVDQSLPNITVLTLFAIRSSDTENRIRRAPNETYRFQSPPAQHSLRHCLDAAPVPLQIPEYIAAV